MIDDLMPVVVRTLDAALQSLVTNPIAQKRNERELVCGHVFIPLLVDPTSTAREGTSCGDRTSIEICWPAMSRDPLHERDFYRALAELATHAEPSGLLSGALSFLVRITNAREAYIEIGTTHGRRGWSASDGCEGQRVEDIRAFMSRGIIAQALTTGAPVITACASSDPRFEHLESVRDGAIEAVLCVPIGSSPPCGVVYLQGQRELRDEETFSEDLQEKVVLLARSLAPMAELFVRRQEDARRLSTSEDAFGEVIATSTVMRDLVKRLAWVATRDVRVLLTGPSGSGKTMLARAIHGASPGADSPFVDLNCAAIPESLLENELFGHVEGAYSSASRGGKKGLVEAAHGGTLFLDEVAELSPGAQAKLLRFLDDGSFVRLGSTSSRRADVRIVSATNVDLEQAVARGRFREDLLFRLKVFVARVPPLSEREDDLLALARHACRRYAAALGLEIRGLSADAISSIRSSAWPGNVRELENTIRNGLLMASLRDATLVEARDLFPSTSSTVEPNALGLHDATQRFQRAHVLSVLEASRSVSDAAQQLGIARSHLYTLMKQHDIKRH